MNKLVDPKYACAYCGHQVLTGEDKPEHPIPAAIGSSLVIRTVCEPCNAWANTNIDQPLLADDWMKIPRADHDVRDHRRAQSRPVRNPFFQGHTKDGVFVSIGENGKPQLGSRIIYGEDETVRIIAGSMDEAERLLKRVEEQAGQEGKRLETVRSEPKSVHPTINFQIKVDGGLWLRAAAKMSLGIASIAYPAEWKTSNDADHLRRLMRDEVTNDDGSRPMLIPMRVSDEERLLLLSQPPQHMVWFQRSRNGTTCLMIMLFGDMCFGLEVDSEGRPVPKIAWQLDPHAPTKNGQTTRERIFMDAAIRSTGSSEVPD